MGANTLNRVRRAQRGGGLTRNGPFEVTDPEGNVVFGVYVTPRITVTDYTSLVNDTSTFTISYGSGSSLVMTSKAAATTGNAEFTKGGSNDATATNIAAGINGLSGYPFTASASGAVVLITGPCDSIVTNAVDALTVETGYVDMSSASATFENLTVEGLFKATYTGAVVDAEFEGDAKFDGTLLVDGAFSTQNGTITMAGNNTSEIKTLSGDLTIGGALQANAIVVQSAESAVDALKLNASAAAGGIDVDAGTGGITVDTTGSFSVDGVADSNVTIAGTQAANKTLTLSCSGAAAANSRTVAITAANGGGGGAVVDIDGITVQIDATTGGVSIDAAGASNLTTSSGDLTVSATTNSVTINAAEAVADAVNVDAAAGGLDVDVGLDIDLNSTGGSVVLTGAEAAADAVRLNASNGGGGIDVDAGTGGIAIDTTATFSIDGVTDSNVTISGTEAANKTLTLSCTGAAAANGRTVAITATNGGGGGATVDIDGITVQIDATSGGVSVDSAGVSNFTVTGAFDLTLQSTQGSVIAQGGEAVVDAVRIYASDAAGGIDVDAGTGGITIDTTGATGGISIDCAATTSASNFTHTGSAGNDLTVSCTAGSLTLNGGEAILDAVNIDSAAGGLDVDVGLDIDLNSTTGSIHLTAAENVADAVHLDASAGYVDIDGNAGVTIDSAAGSVTIETVGFNAGVETFTVTAGGQAIVIDNATTDATGKNLVAIDVDVGDPGGADFNTINVVLDETVVGTDARAITATNVDITGFATGRADIYAHRVVMDGTKNGGDETHLFDVNATTVLNNASERFWAYNASMAGITTTLAQDVYGYRATLPVSSPANCHMAYYFANAVGGRIPAFDANKRGLVTGRIEQGAPYYEEHFFGNKVPAQIAAAASEWNDDGAGGGATAAVADRGNGWISLTTNAGAADAWYLNWNNNGQFVNTLRPTFETRIDLAQFDADTVVNIGLYDQSAPTSYAWFAANGTVLGANWAFQTNDTTGADSSDTGVAASTNEVVLRFEFVDDTTIEYFINGTSCGTTTDKIPTTYLEPYIYIQSRAGGGAAAKAMYIDYVKIWQDQI